MIFGGIYKEFLYSNIHVKRSATTHSYGNSKQLLTKLFTKKIQEMIIEAQIHYITQLTAHFTLYYLHFSKYKATRYIDNWQNNREFNNIRML